MTQGFDDIPEIALDWHRDGKGAALATVVQTWGSAPRQVGSQLAISGAGEIAGSVSGGCVEGAVVVEGSRILGRGHNRNSASATTKRSLWGWPAAARSR